MEAYQSSFDGEPGYLDWAAFGPLSPAVRSEMHADAELLGTGRRSSIDLVSERDDGGQGGSSPRRWVHAVDEVVLQPSTTYGLMQAIYGLRGGLMRQPRRVPQSHRGRDPRMRTHSGDPGPQWLEPRGRVRDAGCRPRRPSRTTTPARSR